MVITLETCQVAEHMDGADLLEVYHVMMAEDEGSEAHMMGHVCRPRDGGDVWELRFKSNPEVLVRIVADTPETLVLELRKRIGELKDAPSGDALQNPTMDDLVQQVLAALYDLAQRTDTVGAFCAGITQALARTIAAEFEGDMVTTMVERTKGLLGHAVEQEMRQTGIKAEVESLFKNMLKTVSEMRPDSDGKASSDETKH